MCARPFRNDVWRGSWVSWVCDDAADISPLWLFPDEEEEEEVRLEHPCLEGT